MEATSRRCSIWMNKRWTWRGDSWDPVNHVPHSRKLSWEPQLPFPEQMDDLGICWENAFGSQIVWVQILLVHLLCYLGQVNIHDLPFFHTSIYSNGWFIDPLEALKGIIHVKPVIIIIIMSTVQPFKNCSFLSFSVTELGFMLIHNPSWC